MKIKPRLKKRLQELLKEPAKVAPTDSESASRDFERAPESEGRILVWRDRFTEENWDEGDAVALFGESVRPLQLIEDLRSHGLDADELRFFDIETCGLADLPIFLIGVLRFRDGAIELAQYFAPDPSAERPMIDASVDDLSSGKIWVSFNGKSFDAPRTRRRAKHHEIEWTDPLLHRDLLHETRRRWKGDLPNCKLTTVETRLLGLERWPGDVPGREVPERYYDFVESGQKQWVEPVIEHNRRDVAAMTVLLRRLGEETAKDALARPERQGDLFEIR